MMIHNTPYLTTQRLELRKFTQDDLDAFFMIFSDQTVNTFLPWYPVENLAQAKKFLKKQYLDRYTQPNGYHYAVCLKTDHIPIGYVNVSTEDSYDLGYGLRKEFWHQGIMTEACEMVVRQLTSDGIPYITATHDVNNPRSGAVMQRIGMQYQYSYQEQWQPKNIPVIFRLYQLNLDGNQQRVYQKYWMQSSVHFIEKL
jgi:ribosomal-protein-alanine N-acetyltransferase